MSLSVTVILITLNDQKIIGDCLSSIRRQKYNGKIEILIVDGGSTDDTIKIADKFKARVISRPEWKDLPNKRSELGINSVQTDVVMFFSADNRFQEDDCLSKMVEPFEDPDIGVVETQRYGFMPKSSLLTKYFALIGGADPIAVALGKADRGSYDNDNWYSYGKVINKLNYFEVTFENDKNKIPTLGANGVAIRNSILKKYPVVDALHIEMCLNFIKHGYDKFAFVKNVHIVHEMDIDLISFIRRRLKWAKMYSGSQMKRNYAVFNLQTDLFKLIWIIISAFTFVIPLFRAIRGYLKYPNNAWFLHPLILPVFVLAYGVQIVKKLIVTALY